MYLQPNKKPRMKRVKINLREVLEERDVEKILLDAGYTYNKELSKIPDPKTDSIIYEWVDDSAEKRQAVNSIIQGGQNCARSREMTPEELKQETQNCEEYLHHVQPKTFDPNGQSNLVIRNTHEEVEHLRAQLIVKETELVALRVSNTQMQEKLELVGDYVKVRPDVAWFSTLMEAKLQKNDYKGGWQNSPPRQLISRMLEECGELITECCIPSRDGWILKQLLQNVSQLFNEETNDGSILRNYFAPLAVVGECIDIANFCMMIAERAEALKLDSEFTAEEFAQGMDKCSYRTRYEDGAAVCTYTNASMCTKERRQRRMCAFDAFRKEPSNDD